ncbi:hypothetical protein B0H10DRAFT_2061508 [Mycena sp. CBHHK59/15]|nr:hypothetical protein B0H10DRAFT_2061508 [Mycena sp. CBHHK59/15]
MFMRPLPDPGSRTQRDHPLVAADLLVNGILLSGSWECDSPIFRCSICLGLKSHPVSTPFGHMFCFVCIRLALESSFNCPFCSSMLHNAPHRVHDFEELITSTYPNQPDNTVIQWDTAWSGLRFPKDA